MVDQGYKRRLAFLLKDSWHAHVYSVLESIHGKPLPEIIEKGFVDVSENRNVPQKQITNWVGNFSLIGEKFLNNCASGSDRTVFWIRLHEILDYLPEYFEVFQPLGLYTQIVRLITEIKDAYSPEELIMIEYQRHCHSHIHQDGYRIRARYNKERKLLEKEGHLYKGRQKLELKEIIGDELKKYAVNEDAMAAAYFAKNRERIDSLWNQLKKDFQL